ncbi:MAG TPA: hypothetical protein VLA89_05940 [Gemmatimonadales bacterium]|nr:hypothetical protein [Gemmatimonadales bacterium]
MSDIETFEIAEGTTPDYVVTLYAKAIGDADPLPIPGSVLDSLTLTYYQEYSEEIINNRSLQNVLQINNVTVDENGLLTWTLQQADSVILDDSLGKEPHMARFDFTYPGANGTEQSRHLVRLLVKNFRVTP